MADEPKESMKERIHNAVEESKKTGQSVNVPMKAPREASKISKGKREKVDRSKLDGKKLDKFLEDNDKAGRPRENLGHFKIIKKEYDEETKTYAYEFDWDDEWLAYAQWCLNKPEGITVDEMNTFCLTTLVAREENALEEDVTVREMKEERRPKFFKKYK